MDKSSSQRLPPLKRNWWLKHRFFKLYMLSAVFAHAWFIHG